MTDLSVLVPPDGALCTDSYRQLADRLGGIPCEGASPWGYVNDPRHLANPTMPFIELLIAVGAVLAFAHAWVRLRRTGDATEIGVCLAAIVYVLVLEPPLYFPDLFGLGGVVPSTFVHNEFTIGFLYNRLPLYILLLYPALVYLAWSLVRYLGIRERHPGWRGIVLASVCVGAVHQAFYAIFDQFGPSHLWWAWGPDLTKGRFLIGDVPMSSAVNFALVMPTAFALTCLVVLGRRPRTTVRSVLGPAVVCGVLTPLVSAPGQVPSTVIDAVATPGAAWGKAVLMGLVVVATAVLVVQLVAAWRRPAAAPADGRGWIGWYPPAYLALWLVTFAVLEVASPPAGVAAYLAPCYLVSVAVLLTVVRVLRRRSARYFAQEGGHLGGEIAGEEAHRPGPPGQPVAGAPVQPGGPHGGLGGLGPASQQPGDEAGLDVARP